jgi:hypothetical protein
MEYLARPVEEGGLRLEIPEVRLQAQKAWLVARMRRNQHLPWAKSWATQLAGTKHAAKHGNMSGWVGYPKKSTLKNPLLHTSVRAYVLAKKWIEREVPDVQKEIYAALIEARAPPVRAPKIDNQNNAYFKTIATLPLRSKVMEMAWRLGHASLAIEYKEHNCARCGQEETQQHVLWECPRAAQVYTLLAEECPSVAHMQPQSLHVLNETERQEVILSWWVAWADRNHKIHEEAQMMDQQVLGLFRYEMRRHRNLLYKDVLYL